MTNIYSFTLKELRDNRDGNFIHHDEYTSELESPTLEFAYANTLKFRIKSSKFGQKVKVKGEVVGTNATWYNVFVLFEDFYTIGRDKDIPFEDAIDYAINFSDVHVRCNCPAHLYWGYAYESSQLKYIYGIPKENRFPIIRNPNLKGTICKHEDAVIQYILRNKDLIVKMFAQYYNRLDSGQSIYAVNTNGTTITIGKKDGENDIFFEQQQQELPDVIEAEDEEETPDVIEAVEEEEGPDVIPAEESEEVDVIEEGE
jgi:hypothetical protein